MSPVGWSHVVGVKAARVVVYEDVARGGMLTLRWRNGDNWRRKTLGRSLEKDRRGNPLPASVDFAIREATRKSLQLSDGIADPAKLAAAAPFTIGETEAAIIHKETGKYPFKSPFRDELARALRFAVIVWGAETPWTAIGETEWVKLIRQRVAGLVAQDMAATRTTEITVSRINTAVVWLRRLKKIPGDAALLPDDWKKEVLNTWRGLTKATRDPQPNRPRHTLEEMRKIIAKAGAIDPRLGLLVQLGAEYRLGQLIRAKRSDLNMHAGALVVHGQGKKGGETIELTSGQLGAARAALGGYLSDLEATYEETGADYYLFPAGKMIGRKAGTPRLGKGTDATHHVSRRWVTKNFHLVEDAAGVPKVKGRAAYGLRRQGVDAANAEGISRQGLQAAGGWSSTKIPDEVYAEQTNKIGRDEAKRVRARTRGETPEALPKDA